MIPQREQLIPVLHRTCRVSALLLLLSVIWLTGCSSDKQTWSDWTKARAAAVAAGKVETNVFIPPPLEAPTLTNGFMHVPGYAIGDGAQAGPGFDLAMRNPDFPRTYIEAVYINLSDPAGGIHVKWAGPEAANCPTGPWRETPGRGLPDKNCDDVDDSNSRDSLCTPKGTFPVAGFADHLKLTPICLYPTWVVWSPRFVAIHSHTDLPDHPASAGCIRAPYEAAKLIHNNSIVGVTLVNITGTWHRAIVKSWQHPTATLPWKRPVARY